MQRIKNALGQVLLVIFILALGYVSNKYHFSKFEIVIMCAVVAVLFVLSIYLKLYIAGRRRITVRRNDQSIDFESEMSKLKISNRVASAVFYYFKDNYQLAPRPDDNIGEVYKIVYIDKFTEIIRDVIKKLGAENDYEYRFERDGELDSITEICTVIQKQYDELMANA